MKNRFLEAIGFKIKKEHVPRPVSVKVWSGKVSFTNPEGVDELIPSTTAHRDQAVRLAKMFIRKYPKAYESLAMVVLEQIPEREKEMFKIKNPAVLEIMRFDNDEVRIDIVFNLNPKIIDDMIKTGITLK